ncbi:PLDc N-terminal domain-containing protein [Capnocytophaga sp. ARDL2]|uniref:PLDc N-terminal domain-containing protein n=1 Tax=Capnocytophaga sp. ARDL2 TaxID=3238809 RepID=UPI003557B870
MIPLSLIGPYHIILFLAVYIVLLGYTIYKIYKNEEGWKYVLWLIICLFFPFIGILLYFLFGNRKR